MSRLEKESIFPEELATHSGIGFISDGGIASPQLVETSKASTTDAAVPVTGFRREWSGGVRAASLMDVRFGAVTR